MAELMQADANGVLSASGGPNKALERLTGNPLATFDPREFDVVIIYGFSLVMQGYLRKFAELAEDGTISSQMRTDAVTEELSRRFAFQYAGKIRRLGKKVIIYAAPYRSERITNERSEAIERHIPEAVEFAKKMAEGVGAEFHIQPTETIVDGYFTAVKYAASNEDDRHMNAAYGAIVLDDISEIIRK